MCEQGTTETIEIGIPATISRTGAARQKKIDVDSCIAKIVQALNNAGLTTIASCCGHNKRPSNIVLADKREIVIIPDYDTARKVDALFSPLNDE